MNKQTEKTRVAFACLSRGSLLLMFMGILLGTVPMLYGQSGTKQWTGATSNQFNLIGPGNWNLISEEGSAAQGINGYRLIVDIPASNLTINNGQNPYSIHIQNGATGFNLTAPTTSHLLTINDYVTVDGNTTATFNVGLATLAGGSNPGAVITLNVGSGGVLNATRGVGVNSVGGQLVKQGAGTLVIGAQRTVQSNVQFLVEEGTLFFNTGNVFASEVNPLEIIVGTSTTSAVLQGRAIVHGTLITESLARSTLDPGGTLTVTNLNLSQGATLDYVLGTDLITGTGALNIGDLAFNFTGGEIGEIYTIFNYGSVTGFDPGKFTINTSGYEGSLWSLDGGLVQVQMIPEPLWGASLLALPLMLGLLRRCNRKTDYLDVV